MEVSTSEEIDAPPVIAAAIFAPQTVATEGRAV
jgi:hypothetical protein